MGLLEQVLGRANTRFMLNDPHERCADCSYGDFCPGDCESCLDYIHTPAHAPDGAPPRKYDCVHMADFYTCKYSCRYTSEMVYALRRLNDLQNKRSIKVLAFGCGPCTDLFAMDFLKRNGEYRFGNAEYRGVDYSQNVWRRIHRDIQELRPHEFSVNFYYRDACELIEEISEGAWIPDLVTFHYVFSDMRKHTDAQQVTTFLATFADFAQNYMIDGSYIVLNDVNLGCDYGGGRDYFDRLYNRLGWAQMRRGRFRNDHARNGYIYPYGDDSDGEFPQNNNLFNLHPYIRYSPFDTCASAQMIIKKGGR